MQKFSFLFLAVIICLEADKPLGRCGKFSHELSSRMRSRNLLLQKKRVSARILCPFRAFKDEGDYFSRRHFFEEFVCLKILS